MSASASSRVPAFLFGIVFTLAALLVGGYAYLRFGHPPVATADAPFPFERAIVSIPLHARINREEQQPPFAASPAVFEAGAHLYMDNCATCHGTLHASTTYSRYMFPRAPQLWATHRAGVVGVSDDPAGETYWKIANGIRLSGMPAYNKLLSPEQMWQIALLLHSADQTLPEPVTATLSAAPTVPLASR